MDERVKHLVAAGFAADLYETVKAARRVKGETAFRHTMWEGPGALVFCALYPKADVLNFPGLTTAFAERLSTFNAVGVLVGQDGSFEYYYLGGGHRPFTALDSAQALAGLLSVDATAQFLAAYFRVRGLDLDLEQVDYETFLKKVEAQVLAETPLSVLSQAAENVRHI